MSIQSNIKTDTSDMTQSTSVANLNNTTIIEQPGNSTINNHPIKNRQAKVKKTILGSHKEAIDSP